MKQDQKSLQKLTDSNEPRTQEELIQKLYQQYPRPPQEASSAQKRKHLELITNGILASSLLTEDKKQDLRNQTWEDNHNTLIETIHNTLIQKKIVPTVQQLAKKTGLSRQTISKHLATFRSSEPYQNRVEQFRMMAAQVMAQLFSLSMSGNVKAAKVFLDNVGGLANVEAPSANQSTASYIQINNNVKIDQLTFTMLPQTVQQQITGLILQGLQTTLSHLPASEEKPVGDSSPANGLI